MKHAALKHDIKTISESFEIYGDYIMAEPYGSGHINDTYRAAFNQGGTLINYIFQRINHNIFKNPPALMENIHRHMLGGKPLEEQYRIIWPDGSVHWVETRGVFIHDGNGKFIAELGDQILRRPAGLAIEPKTRNIYVADVLAHQVVILSPEGKLVGRLGERGAAARARHPQLRLAALGEQQDVGALGGELLKACASRLPDCLLLDLHMPDLNGFEVLERLAAQHLRVPVVVITGQDQPGNAERVRALGALDYLLKPLNESQLLAAIRKVIGTIE